MFFIPLNQLESVELVIHALRMAGGQADCESCPARRVCMQQCLTIAESVGKMLQAGTLPTIGQQPLDPDPAPAAPPGRRLKVVK
jgi:hypothetical protein